jgi:ribonucleoside-diphosphate reductase alpha chain
MNLLHYDEWKDSDAVQVMTKFLDTVIEEFIEKTEDLPFMEAPRKFSMTQRAIGIGVLGWHSYLQSKDIAFEDLQAKSLTNDIFKHIESESMLASAELAKTFGEPEKLKGSGRRNMTTQAVAPTTSSSFILGQVSPSVEPLNSNYFVKDLAKGKFTYKNPHLKEVLKKYGNDTTDVWKSILVTGGSVQHLMFLSDHEKDVFKTFGEISQKEIILQTGIRQKYIDQSQSINLMIHPKTPPRDVNQLLIYAWEQGVKTLYYHRGTNPSQELSRNLLTCTSCEG